MSASLPSDDQSHAIAGGGNKLLPRIGACELEFLATRGERCFFSRGEILSEADQAVEYAYFIESGIASVVKWHDEKKATEICLVGPEGFTGFAIAQGDGQTPYETFVQSQQLVAWRVSADDLRSLFNNSPGFRDILLSAVYVQMVQVAENLISAVWQRTPERLARWLIMYYDRVCSPQLEVTHEFMATMIGAQRTKVTEALHEIEATGAISALRGRVVIKDTAILKRVADGTYGIAEAEADRLYR